MKPGEDVASLDVTALFTMVPLKENVESTAELLSQTDALGDLSKDTFQELRMLAVSNVVFPFKGKYYKQKDGVAMGAHLKPLLANIFMSKFNRKILEAASGTVYERYKDVIFLTTDI